MNENLVTVCITTYNRKELLPTSLKSVLTQTYDNIEVIIVDDHSTDGTKELVENELLNLDERIRYIRHERNKGLAAGRNSAIFAAKGKYFTFVDDDDTWKPDFLSTFVEIAQNHDDSYAFCASIISDIKDKPVAAIKANLRDLLILGYTPPVASQFYFTGTLKKVGGYDETIKSGVDHDLWLTLGLYNIKIIWLNKKLVNVNPIASDNRMTYNINKRINGINNSMKRWKERIGISFGKNFFVCFEKNYQYNTYKKFILHNLKNKEYSKLFLYWKKLPKDLFLLDIKRYFLVRITKKSLLRKPVFMNCNKFLPDFLSKIEVMKSEKPFY